MGERLGDRKRVRFAQQGARRRGRLVDQVLSPRSSSASAARKLIRATLGGRLDDDVLDVAVLLVDELVANVYLHAGSGARLRVHLGDDGRLLRVEVDDDSAELPLECVAGLEDDHGRGLTLVRRLSSRSGCAMRNHCGKTMWFELDA